MESPGEGFYIKQKKKSRIEKRERKREKRIGGNGKRKRGNEIKE